MDIAQQELMARMLINPEPIGGQRGPTLPSGIDPEMERHAEAIMALMPYLMNSDPQDHPDQGQLEQDLIRQLQQGTGYDPRQLGASENPFKR